MKHLAEFTSLAVLILMVLPSLALAQPPDTLWSRTWNHDLYAEESLSINATHDGGFILCGSSKESGLYSAWLMRVDQNGEMIWERNWGGTEQSDGFSYVEQTSVGDFIGGGGTWTWSPNTTSAAHVTRISSDGMLLWSAQVSNPNYDDGTSCVVKFLVAISLSTVS